MRRPLVLSMIVCVTVIVVALSSRPPRVRTTASRLAHGEPSAAALDAPAALRPTAVVDERVVFSDTTTDAERGCFGAPAGTRLVFDVAASQHTAIALGDPGAQEDVLELALEGELVLDLLERRSDEVLARVWLPRVDLRIDGHGFTDGDDASQRELATPAAVRIRKDGSVAGWAFVDGTSDETRLVFDSLFALARFVVPAGVGASWSTVEDDSTGSWRVEYIRSEARDPRETISRRRTELVPRASEGSLGMRADVTDEAQAEFDVALGWMTTAEARQRIELDIGDTARVEARSEVRWRLREHRHRPPESGIASWDLAWTTAVAPGEDTHGAAPEVPVDPALLIGRSLESLLYGLETLVATTGLHSRELYDARQLLKAYLQTRPDELARFTALLADGSLSEDALGVALSALGSVAGEEGQAWLGTVLVDGTWSDEARVLASIAAFQIDDPVQALRGAVAQLWDDPTVSPALRSTALLLLGTQARGSEVLARDLLAREAEAAAGGLLSSFVAALGNAGLVSEAERFREHPDAAVRAAAAHVLAGA